MARFEERVERLFSLIDFSSIFEVYEDEEILGEEEKLALTAIKEVLKPGPAALSAMDSYEYFSDAVEPALAALGFEVNLKGKIFLLHPISGPHRTKPLGCFAYAPYAEDMDRRQAGLLHRGLIRNRLKWGILTNLRTWRLYNSKEKPFHVTYDEIQLPEALKNGREFLFKKFLFLFGANQFRPASKNRLDALVNDSKSARAYLLKMFSKSAKSSAGKFGDSREVIIRLLLIKWAEDAGVLPLKENRIFRERFSFTRLMNEIAGRLAKDFKFSETSRRYHQGLLATWDSLEHGHPPWANQPGSDLKPVGKLAGLPNPKFIPDSVFAPAAHDLLRMQGAGGETDDTKAQPYYPFALVGAELLWSSAYHAAPALDADKKSSSTRPSSWLAERHPHPDLQLGRSLVKDILDTSGTGKSPFEQSVLHLGLGFGEIIQATIEALAESAADQGMASYQNAAYTIAQRCIYGIDPDSYSVNIATGALNMAAAIPGRPLPTPTHRVIRGNAMLGARLNDLASPGLFGGRRRRGKKRPKQASLFEFAFAKTVGDLLTDFDLMTKVPNEDMMDPKDRGRIIERLKKSAERYIAVADVWVAARLGLSVPQAEYMELIDLVDGPSRRWKEIISRAWFRRAEEIARDRGFVHWELFFPEIFFSGRTMKPEPGFDAIAGWLPASSAADLLRLSLQLLKTGGRAGFYLTKQSFNTLDEVLLERAIDIKPVPGRRGYRAIFENKRSD